MRRFALLGSSGELTGIGPELKGKKGTTLLASPLETHAYLIDLPPLKKEMVAGALRFKLRALHPGDPDRARIDFHPNGDKPHSFLAFVSDKTVMERCLAPGLPVAAPVSVLSAFAAKRKGTSIAFFWTDRWVEAVRFEARRIAAIEAVPVEDGVADGIKAAFERLRSSFPGGFSFESVPVMVAHSSAIGPEAIRIRKILADSGAEDPALINIDTTPLPAGKPAFGLYEWSGKKKAPSLASVALVLLAANLGATAWTINQVANARERESARLKAAYESGKKHFAATEVKRKELLKMEKEFAEYRAKRPLDAYAAVSEIYGRLGQGAWVKSLVIRKDAFSVEAEGVDAIKAFSNLERSPILENIKLHQAHPSAIKGEAFSLSGTIRDDR